MTDVTLSLILDDSAYQASAKRVAAANKDIVGSQEKIGPSTTRAAQSFMHHSSGPISVSALIQPPLYDRA